MVDLNSDSEDPLYSKVKPKKYSKTSDQHQHFDGKGENEVTTSDPKKKLSRVTVNTSDKKLQGIENEAYIGKACL